MCAVQQNQRHALNDRLTLPLRSHLRLRSITFPTSPYSPALSHQCLILFPNSFTSFVEAPRLRFEPVARFEIEPSFPWTGHRSMWRQSQSSWRGETRWDVCHEVILNVHVQRDENEDWAEKDGPCPAEISANYIDCGHDARSASRAGPFITWKEWKRGRRKV